MLEDTKVPLRPPNGWVPPSFALTSTPENADREIIFRHPAYPSRSRRNILLTLLACDHPKGGLHHETAQIACGIVGGNAWNGYFAYSAGGEPIGLGSDEILSAENEYYFHVPHPEGSASQSGVPTSPIYKYPVCPTFRHWVFPHDNLPPSWPRPTPQGPCVKSFPPAPSSLASAVIRRDSTCRMTDQRDGAQCAHLCPGGEFSWFVGNNMMSYNKNRYLPCDNIMDDLNNAITLRSDLHIHFDRRIFAFVPKALKTDKTPRYVSHVLQITGGAGVGGGVSVWQGDPFSETERHILWVSTPLMSHIIVYLERASPAPNSSQSVAQYIATTGPLYHNAFIYPIDIPREFLFARFAWAIFPSLESFLISGSERLLLINQDGSGVPKNVSANECFELAGPSRSVSRSRSAGRKRKARSTPQKSNIGADSRESTPYSQHKRQRLSPTESPTSNPDNQQHFQPLKEPTL